MLAAQWMRRSAGQLFTDAKTHRMNGFASVKMACGRAMVQFLERFMRNLLCVHLGQLHVAVQRLLHTF